MFLSCLPSSPNAGATLLSAGALPAWPGWSEFLAIVNGAGLIAAVGAVSLAGIATLLFRRW